MAPSPPPASLTRLHDAARRHRERAATHQQEIEALVETAAQDVDAAAAALSAAAPGSGASDVAALRAHLHRSEKIAAAARALCVEARAQQEVAGQLVNEIDAATAAVEHTHASAGASIATVLVVDDYEDTRDLLSFVLREAGFTVHTASNGLEGLLAAYVMQPSVIVMDVAMPVLDGIEATRLIKALESVREARIIAYSAQAVLNDPGVRRLFSAILQKPATPDDVVATVQRCAAH